MAPPAKSDWRAVRCRHSRLRPSGTKVTPPDNVPPEPRSHAKEPENYAKVIRTWTSGLGYAKRQTSANGSAPSTVPNSKCGVFRGWAKTAGCGMVQNAPAHYRRPVAHWGKS